MLFNSIEFLIFFPLVTLIYFMLPHKLRWLHLLIASCVFYMFFIPVYILILFGTIVIDYAVGILLENAKQSRKKTYLILSLIANIGILAVFKYYNFFIENVNELLTSINYTVQPLPYLNIILPIGLSFHTFQAMSYTIEVYRGNQKAERHFGIYALYVMFYPQLVAGPIERPQNMLHQFHEKHTFNSNELLAGLRLMLWGFFKKLVIADRLSIYVDAVYENPEAYHYGNIILALFFFAIQIYCDFSGYSDIAIGSARTMGFKLMTNFNKPYFSKNIKEFWSRWHISLSTWFKDYVYIPLGGNKVAKSRLYFNIAVVFILSGFWHGASWAFIIWGMLHALFNIVYMASEKKTLFAGEAIYFKNFLAGAFTFLLVTLAWVFFRAENMHIAMGIYKGVFTLATNTPFSVLIIGPDLIEFGTMSIGISFIAIAVLFSVEKIFSVDFHELDERPVADMFFSTTIITLLILFGVFHNASFIYFQF